MSHQAAVELFVDKVVEDISAAFAVTLAMLGDRLGLFCHLAENGPATPAEFAKLAGIDVRYAQEWLGGMASAGYVEYNAADGRFLLPAEHIPAIAQEGGKSFMGGAYQMWGASLCMLSRIEEAFRGGGGVAQRAFGEEMRSGIERFSRAFVDHELTQEWIPAMPDVEAKLKNAAVVADVGCGRGGAVIRLAQSYPSSTFVGIDVSEPTVIEAVARAAEAGMSERVAFQYMDASQELPGVFDVITTFDVIHTAVAPSEILRTIRKALKSDGIYVCLSPRCSPKLEDNLGPIGVLFYGFSVLYDMTTSLAEDGLGLGTLGCHELKLRELCADAGFSAVRCIPTCNRFYSLYEVRP